MFSIIVANFIASIVRYMQSLKFISIPTGLYLSDSVATLQSFLHHHKFAFTRHPEIPEVFQIMSRNISAGKEDREIVLFVADDNRILINSHFTNSWSFFPSRRHHKEIAKMMGAYINTSQHTTALRHQTF